jgi:hypothetical protein
MTTFGVLFWGPFSGLNGIPVRISPGGVILGVQNDPYRGHSGGVKYGLFSALNGIPVRIHAGRGHFRGPE